jgi:hypothetical protein
MTSPGPCPHIIVRQYDTSDLPDRAVADTLVREGQGAGIAREAAGDPIPAAPGRYSG